MTFAAEDRLIFDAVRLDTEAGRAERIADLARADGIDWSYIFDASIRHAVAPLLRQGLRKADERVRFLDRVPRWFLRNVDELYTGSVRRNERMHAAIATTVARFDEAGIPVLGLKDLVLGVTTYPDPALRPLGDVDLLIRRDDYAAAAALLGSLGFEARPSVGARFMLTYGAGQHFRRAADDLWLDVQWNVMQREWDPYSAGTFTYDPDDMWRTAVTVDLGGTRLRAPASEEMLFHLCLHLEGHAFAELILLCDIAELLRHGPKPDWEKLEAIARRYRQESSVYYALLVAQLLLDAPVPEDVLVRLEPPYFHGAILGPLFGGLTSLHAALDDIELTSGAPREASDKLELVVRRQAARSIALDRELDSVVHAFQKPVVFSAVGGPTRIFPTPALPAFPPLDAFVAAGDAGRLRSVLADLDFAGSGASAFAKTEQIDSTDPALAGHPTTLGVRIEVSTDAARSFEIGETVAASNARSALQSLRTRAHGDDDAQASLVVHALEPTELAAAVLARVGGANDDRLFGICSLLELERLADAIDPRAVIELARLHGAEPQVADGLRLLAAVVPGRPSPDGYAAPRMLEWARYGPESVNRLRELRTAYYAALVGLTLDRAGERARFAAKSALSALRPSTLRAAGAALVRGMRPVKPAVTDHAYWIDADVAARLVLDGAQRS